MDLFSKQERIFIVFLMIGIFVGSGIELYRARFKKSRNTDHLKSLDIFDNRIKIKAALIDSLQQISQRSNEERNLYTDKRHKTRAVNQENVKENSLRIDINLATIEELIRIPNIGPVTANRIIEYRVANGKFTNTDDLINIKGIGEKKLSIIKKYIYINNN